MTKPPIRTEERLDDEQRGLLAWSGVVSEEEALDRLKDHVILLAVSLRLAIRRDDLAMMLLKYWLDNWELTSDPVMVARSKELLRGSAP